MGYPPPPLTVGLPANDHLRDSTPFPSPPPTRAIRDPLGKEHFTHPSPCVTKQMSPDALTLNVEGIVLHNCKK